MHFPSKAAKQKKVLNKTISWSTYHGSPLGEPRWQFIIDEIFVAIPLPPSLPGGYGIDSIFRTPRKLQIFPGVLQFWHSVLFLRRLQSV